MVKALIWNVKDLRLISFSDHTFLAGYIYIGVGCSRTVTPWSSDCLSCSISCSISLWPQLLL